MFKKLQCKTYYRLVKPGIVYGNAMTALAAFVFASGRHVDAVLLIGMLVGISFTIAAACVVNNILDKDIDKHMERTKDRAIPTGIISTRNAFIFAAGLFLIGFLSLFLVTNLLALAVTLFGVFVYLALYTPLKRLTLHSTIIGALAGAVPPVVGYVSVTNSLDLTALLLFLILVCWQMTHFLAISIFRIDEYGRAKLPVMSVRVGVYHTKIVMIVYAFLFAFAVYALYVLRDLGLVYALSLGLFSAGWIILSFTGLSASNDRKWAFRMFFYSIAILLVFCLALALS